LPADQRQAFVLHADGEFTYAQIAEAQGVPIGTVMSRIYYARRKLRELLAGVVDETDGKDTSA
jgi:RNA polymerase sigma-70 factor, ECF subfamily